MSRTQQHDAVLAALSDVVTVAPAHQRNVSQPGDASAPYYQGAAPLSPGSTQPAVPSKDAYDPLSPALKSEGGIGARFAAAFRRHTTEEKEAKRREKERRMKGEMSKAESKNSRMDIIDRLDHSGIHGASMFHHDSPYDACSPHANRNMRRAPVGAFDPNVDPLTGKPLPRGGAAAASSRPRAAAQQGNGKGLSELAQGTLRKMNANESELDHLPNLAASSSSSSAPLGASQSQTSFDDAATDTTHSSLERDPEAERAYRSSRADWGGASSKSGARTDPGNPHADIWGVASEPWQDFAAPAQPTRRMSNKAAQYPTTALGVPQSGNTSAASSVLDMEAVMTGRTSKAPINSAGDELDIPGVSPFPERDWSADGAGPKRSKSLIKRIKSARQNPNTPALDSTANNASELELGALKARRTTTGGAGHRYSPSTPPLSADGKSLGQSSALALQSGSLGRSGTLRPRGSPRSGEATTPTDGSSSPAGTPNAENALHQLGGLAEPRGRVESGSGSGTSGGLGRNGSIFGRFGPKKTRIATKSTEREREVAVAR